MQARTITAFLFIAIFSVFIADFTVGCGQGYVYGQVTQKFSPTDRGDVIAVNGTPYSVPSDFYARVRIGDFVRFDGKEWSIVKPGQTNVPPISP